MPRFPSKGPRFLAFLILGFSLGRAAVLSIPGRSANNGQFIASAVTLTTEQSQISGLQFDLLWDEGLEVQVASGGSPMSAGKLLYAVPLGTRHLRILVAGMNATAFADGTLLRLFVAVNAIGQSATVVLRDVVGVTPGGDPVAIGTSDGVLIRDATLPVNSILADSVLNAASLLPGPLAPGEVVTLLGAFGIDASTSPEVAASANRAPLKVLYALGNQVNAILPLDMDPANPVELDLHDAKHQLARITLPTTTASPALFTQSGSGLGPGAILNQDYSLNTAGNPASGGSIVMMYGTAFGPLNPSDGQLPPQTAWLVTASIGGAPADVVYAGAAPGLPDGVIQINVRVPETVGPGDQPIALRAGNFAIQNGVTLAVR